MQRFGRQFFLCFFPIMCLIFLHQMLESQEINFSKIANIRFTGFQIVLPDEYLVYAPASGTLQIIALGNVLSYGSNWKVAKVKPTLYHLRVSGFPVGDFYMVNTSTKKFYRVAQGIFDQLGGNETLVPECSVEVVGGAGNTTPDRFYLRVASGSIHVGMLGYDALAKKVILGFMGVDATVPGDWQICGCGANIFHFKHKNWAGFYWKDNILSKTARRCHNGVFFQPGGTDTPLNLEIIVNH